MNMEAMEANILQLQYSINMANMVADMLHIFK